MVAVEAVAISVTLCAVPGVRVREAGLAETPAGKPVIATATELANPLDALANTLTDCPVAPGGSTIVVGDAVMEKSGAVTGEGAGAAAGAEPPPQPRNPNPSKRPKARTTLCMVNPWWINSRSLIDPEIFFQSLDFDARSNAKAGLGCRKEFGREKTRRRKMQPIPIKRLTCTTTLAAVNLTIPPAPVSLRYTGKLVFPALIRPVEVARIPYR
jgi:hypothetical protein